MLVQVYIKRGCLILQHVHDSEQMTYVLVGALKFHVGSEEITVREGEVHIPSGVAHQAERSKTPSTRYLQSIRRVVVVGRR